MYIYYIQIDLYIKTFALQIRVGKILNLKIASSGKICEGVWPHMYHNVVIFTDLPKTHFY